MVLIVVDAERAFEERSFPIPSHRHSRPPDRCPATLSRSHQGSTQENLVVMSVDRFPFAQRPVELNVLNEGIVGEDIVVGF